MNENGVDMMTQEGLIQKFVECRLRELNGEELSSEEASFIEALELASLALPGVLEESLLEVTLTQAHASLSERLAAASLPEQETAYDKVMRSIDKRSSFVSLEMRGRSVDILLILSEDGPVAPVYHAALTFIIEKENGDPHVVSPYGGIYLSLDELKTMRLSLDAKAEVIRLHHN